MKSITIHNLDTPLAKRIEDLAAESGLSQNKLIKRLLRQALGLDAAPTTTNDFEKFAGTWTAADEKAFASDTGIFNTVDEELWD
jgi:hypothetical protein